MKVDLGMQMDMMSAHLSGSRFRLVDSAAASSVSRFLFVLGDLVLGEVTEAGASAFLELCLPALSAEEGCLSWGS